MGNGRAALARRLAPRGRREPDGPDPRDRDLRARDDRGRTRGAPGQRVVCGRALRPALARPLQRGEVRPARRVRGAALRPAPPRDRREPRVSRRRRHRPRRHAQDRGRRPRQPARAQDVEALPEPRAHARIGGRGDPHGHPQEPLLGLHLARHPARLLGAAQVRAPVRARDARGEPPVRPRTRQAVKRAEIERLRTLVPPRADAPVRVAPADVRKLRPLARVTAVGSARVLRSEPANIFRVLGRHPSLFRAWLRYSSKLMPRGKLPRRDAELVILRVAWRTGAAYEWHQHVLLGARAGLGEGEIERAASEDVAGWGARDSMLVSATDELLASSRLSDETWAAVERDLDVPSAIELCILVGQYQGLGTALGGLGVPIERSRDG